MTVNNSIRQLSIRELLDGENDYLIPMYQRNYAWDEGEITQLIQDVIDYQPKSQDYYIGTLVVFERGTRDGRPVYEVIDGQQRLTTLSLLVTYLLHTYADDFSWYQRLNVQFEQRENSRQTFKAIFDKQYKGDPPELVGVGEINSSVLNGYRVIHRIFHQKLKDNEELTAEAFYKYLLERVQVMRVTVPDDTDLNHYFEVMNNRGEQLEKHEVLKSRLLEVLNGINDPQDREASGYVLHKVWEACSAMGKYVQAGFSTKERPQLFGADWAELKVDSFEDLKSRLLSAKSGSGMANQSDEIPMDELIKLPLDNDKGDEALSDDGNERFHSVINFPNFLLHVLRVHLAEDVRLDDKGLLDTFEKKVIRQDDAAEQVKAFTFALLRCRYLFDHCILKREFLGGKDQWSVKRYKKSATQDSAQYVNTFGQEGDDANRKITMLLAAFHVSTPTLVFKHWLNGALYWLYSKRVNQPDAVSYLESLDSLAKAFVFDRFLAEPKRDYFDIIYRDEGRCQRDSASLVSENIEAFLRYGKIENNLVFNYLDYLLWLQQKSGDSRVDSFVFSFRSSVEHYYPQNPRDHEKWDRNDLDQFGNLCLISHSKNSRLSDYLPKAKQEHYADGSIDSIKQYLMMKNETWDVAIMREHHKAMIDVLLVALQQGNGDV